MAHPFGGSSKLAPPSLPPRLVSRPRLTTMLDSGTTGPLTLVAAGPGSGKTVLLSGWAARSNLPTAWLSLDAEDNDPVRFWTLAGEAMLAAGIVGQTDGFAALPHAADPGLFLGALLEAIPGPVELALVVDDAHVLTDPAILAELDGVVRYGFPRIRLVLSSRCDPLLPLHRYRLAGQMCELRAADLAMTQQEAQSLLQAHGVRLPNRELSFLTQRTEGWTAGLRLSAMTMAGSAQPEQFVTQLALDQGSVGEYLMEEVLDRQPAVVRRLLVQTSFLTDVTGPLAAAVTGIENSSALLAELSRSNSFVVALDHDRDRYRYHQLLGEILRYLLRREYPAEVIAQLRQRAAAWYQSQDDHAAAIRFAAQAGDWERVCQVLVHGGFARAFVDRQPVADVDLTAVAALDPEFVGGRQHAAEVRVAQAAILVAGGEPEVARTCLTQARVTELSPDASATAQLVDVLVAQRTGAAKELDRAVTVLLDGGRNADNVHTVPGLPAAVRIAHASAGYWEGVPTSAIEWRLREGLRDARQVGAVHLELEALGLLQLAFTAGGRAIRARECEAQSLALVRQSPPLQRMTVHHIAHAYGAFMRGDQVGAERALHRAQQSSAEGTDPAMAAAVVLFDVRVLIWAGRAAEAHQLLVSAPELEGRLPEQVALNRTLTLAEIEILLGRPHAALRTMDASHLEPKQPSRSVVAARAFLAMGDGVAAQRALRPALVSAESPVPLPLIVAALLASSRAAELLGDEAKAVEEVLRAADLATEAIVQPFVTAYPSLAGLLSRHPEANAAWPKMARGVAVAPVASSVVPPQLAEPLTERESVVLRRLATNMTNAEIADELCVSINTVKTHVAAIYRKLPAAGRRDAVSRARQLELM